MRQITKGKVDRPGAVPGTSTDLTTDSKREKEPDTEQCSVKSATELPPSDTREGLVGDGKELPPPTVRWCRDCLEEGERTALALDGPSRELCEFHRERRVLRQAQKCARKGCAKPARPESVWCWGHATCDASVSLDNVPAVSVRRVRS